MESKRCFAGAQHDKIPLSLRASVTSVAINRHKIPTKQESQHVRLPRG
ncbi:MAG: hypothetical protein K2N54_04665 [Helicobacter sp.]|nr:hypothetical protein [Helicobacter sp.]